MPRLCLVEENYAMMEAKLCLATIAQNWTFDLTPDQVIIPEPVITLRPRDGIQMVAHERVKVETAPVMEL
jgi:cytochrome P450